MKKVDELRRSLVAFDQESSMVVVIELIVIRGDGDTRNAVA